MLSCELDWKLTVTIGDFQWIPKKRDFQTIDGDAFLHINPWDHGLIKALTKGDCPKYINRPSLTNTPGYKSLFEARNSQQAKHMQEAPAEMQQRRRLFVAPADAEQGASKKQRLSAQQVKEQRAAPSIFEVQLGAMGDFVGSSVNMLQPVKANDEIWIRASAESIKDVLNFMIQHGIPSGELTSKRGYNKKGEHEGDAAGEGGAQGVQGNHASAAPADEQGEEEYHSESDH